ncbi:hypothetical protein PS723_04358 [Pseudomonas fluorescens]|uniref:DUF3077 domain-containing protein n=2 Tax=Pseudomonas fluorescens TaxID=294 RepID=A0A5E7E803_PSEFL|nr:hypothetical protein PS723_04358 [Pseudomonas fluorescens]
MSHPKNSTSKALAQVAVTQPFEVVDHMKDEFLQVRHDVAVTDALELSSARLSEVLLFIRDHTDEESGLRNSGVHLIQEHLAGAKALLDSSVNGIIAAQRAGGAQ